MLTQAHSQASAVPIAHQPVGQGQERQAPGDGSDKGPLMFEVRGSEVELQKIERWMKRHDVVDSFLYAPSPAACKTARDRCVPSC
jgi:hypothetical protein